MNFYPPGRLLALYPPLPLDPLASRTLEAEPRTRPEEEDALTMDLPAADHPVMAHKVHNVNLGSCLTCRYRSMFQILSCYGYHYPVSYRR